MPTKPLAPCPTCRALDRCAHRLPPGRRTYNNRAWRTLSKAVRQRHPRCAWCGTTTDLTADHITNGTLQGGVRTLCRSCNSRRGGT